MDLSSFSVSFKCCVFANFAFWTASLANVAVDNLAQSKRSDIQRLKLQPVFLTSQELWDVFVLSALNMVLIAPLICCPLFEWMWSRLQLPGIRLQETDEWQWQREIMNIPMIMLVNEITFYAARYLMHASPLLYQHVHKIHHRFKAPCAMAATYAHPLEFVFGNVLSIGAGPILTNAHPYTAYAWFTLALLSTCKSHSGYDILDAKTHDDHHQFTKFNFGNLQLGDYLMGTGDPGRTRRVKGL